MLSSTAINVSVSHYDILLSVLKWITVDGRPLDIINDEGFQCIKGILKQIPDTLVLNQSNLRNLLRNAAQSVRTKMREVFKNNHLSIKMDGGSYHSRKFLGITAQCRKQNNIQEFSNFTLGCVEVDESQTKYKEEAY